MSVPSRADDTIFPGVLAGVLAVLLGIQLWLTGVDPELPPVLPVSASRVNTRVPNMAPVFAAREIFDRPLFAPRQSLTASRAGMGAVMGGAIVAGTITVRGRSLAIVRRSDGTIANLAIGGLLDGWRLAALQSSGAIFVRGKERRTIPYGSATVAEVEEEAPAE